MMEIGKLYQTKELYWLIYPSKDIAYDALTDAEATGALVALAAAATRLTPAAAAYYSKRFNCNVSYLNPKSIFCFLEKNGKFCKILSTEGNIGWIHYESWGKNDIEEVTP